MRAPIAAMQDPDTGAWSTRSLIVEAADRLIYEQGYEHTSFAHIADAVGISRGNFYHHFKTKDEILDAVVERRIAGTRAMLEVWERTSEEPAERVRCFIRMLIDNRAPIMRHGCPVGSLCAELAKLDHPSREEAAALFTLFRQWLARQIGRLGLKLDADAVAMHLLVRSQGIALMASTFRDEAFLRRETQSLDAWFNDQLARPRASGRVAPSRPPR